MKCSREFGILHYDKGYKYYRPYCRMCGERFKEGESMMITIAGSTTIAIHLHHFNKKELDKIMVEVI